MQVANIQNNFKKLAFSSNIRFVSKLKYDKLKMFPSDFVREMESLSDVRKIKKVGRTDRIIYCLAGVLDAKEKYIFHWYPSSLFKENHEATPELLDIEKALKILKKTNNLNGFLLGGLSNEVSLEYKLISLKLFNSFSKILKPEGKKNFTTFFGQKGQPLQLRWGFSSFIYKKSSDTYYVNCQNYKPYCNTPEDLLKPKKIKDNFAFINIAPKDKVFVGDDSKIPIPHAFWNKNEYKHRFF